MNEKINSPNGGWFGTLNFQVVVLLLSLEVCKDDRDGVSGFGQ